MNKNKKVLLIVTIVIVVFILVLTGIKFFNLIKSIDDEVPESSEQSSSLPKVEKTQSGSSIPKFDDGNSCQDFDEVSSLIFEKFEKAYKEEKENNKNFRVEDPQVWKLSQYNEHDVMISFKWRRNAEETYITYPIIRGEDFSFDFQFESGEKVTSSDAFSQFESLLARGAKSIEQEINFFKNDLGMTVNETNTLPHQILNEINSNQTFAFQKGSDLYKISFGLLDGAQSPPFVAVTITCGKAVDDFDKFYDTFDLEASNDPRFNTYQDDYINIFEVSPKLDVFGVEGRRSGKTEEGLDFGSYYSFDGESKNFLSNGSVPVECETLEQARVGRGMRCIRNPGPFYQKSFVEY